MSYEDGFPHFEETKNAGLFKRYIQQAKRANKNGSAVDIHKVGDYKKMKMFATRDGLAGYAVNENGELNSVFKHPDSPYENVGRRAAEHSILMGGATHLSAFENRLPDMYAKGGFRPLSRVQWNEEYKPKGWKVRTQKRPGVIFAGADRSVAMEANSGNYRYREYATPPAADYDAGMEHAKKVGEGDKQRVSEAAVKNAKENFGKESTK